MSLAVLADHMASKGRGPDSMLIHMSPREVQGLQALAMANGGSLTINPDTGLPEAGFLDKLLPAIIGFAVTAATGLPAWQVGLGVGAVETARTGDLGKGISAGLGAYGGAGMGAGFGTAGSEAIGSQAAGQSYLASAPGVLADAGAGLTGDMAYNLQNAGSSLAGEGAASAAQQAAAERIASASPFEKISRGFDAAKANPMSFANKDNFKYLAAAAGPILADQAVKSNLPQTTTKPGMITPYSFFGGQYVPGQAYQASPTRSADGGLMGLAAGGMAGYGDGDDVPRRTIDGMAQGGMYDFAQRSEPVVRMAQGGILKMAGGTPPAMLSDEQLYQKTGSWEAAAAARDQQNRALNIFNDAQRLYSAVGAAPATQAVAVPGVVDTTKPGQYVTDPTTGNAVALSAYSPGFDPNNKITQTYLGELAAKGGTDTTSQMFNQMGASQVQQDANASAWATEKARLEAIDAANAAKAPTGLAGLNQNQNLLTNQNQGAGLAALANIPDGASYTNRFFAERGLGFDPIDKSIDNFLATYKNQLAAMTPKQQEDAMRAALDVEKMNEADVIKATGMTIAQLAAAKRADGSLVVPGNLDEVPVGSLPGGVSGGSNTVINDNGTITTKPDFDLTMNEVRKSYTDGGGSLGYTSPTFDSLKAVEEKYPLRGAAKKSYDYLMGREDYDPIPYTKDGQISKSYNESVMKLPKASASKMYIFQNGKFVPNPDYAIPTYDKDGKKSSNLTNADVKTYMDKSPSVDAFYTWATTNNLSPEQIAMASGRPINEISKLFTGAKELTNDEGKIDQTKVDEKTAADEKANFDATAYLKANQDVMDELNAGKADFGTKADLEAAAWEHYQKYGKAGGRKYTKKAAGGGLMAMARGGMAQQFNLGDYSDGGRLLRGPGDGVSDSIPATIGGKRPARLADGEFVVPARIVSELGNGSTEAGARKLYAMMDRVQKARRGTVGKGRVAKNSRSDKYLPA
tara:strand:- start:3786 stop:6704 length:2919 start_codon:yes stop_codon:yes gene_type:complete